MLYNKKLSIFEHKNITYRDFSLIVFGKSDLYASLIAFFSLLLGIILNIFSNSLNDIAFLIILLITNTLTAYGHIKPNLGILPTARFFFLVSPGFIQYIIWYFSNDLIRIAFLGNDYLTTEIIKNIGSLSTIAGSASLLGFVIKPISFSNKTYSFLKNFKSWKNTFFLLFSSFAILYALTIGESLFVTGSYGADEGVDSVLKIGTLNVFYFFFISVFFLLISIELKLNLKQIRIFTISFFIIIFYIAIRGVRQDSLGVILALMVITYFMQMKYGIIHYKIIILFFLTWFASVFTGIIRANFSISTILSSPIQLFISLFKEVNNYLVLNLDTASMTIGTLNVIPYKIIEKGYLYGSSYFEWIPRTLPAFINPNRPEDISFQMQYNGEWFGWGGIHEVAEAYWNFGIFGVIIVPFLFSYIMNTFGKRFIKSKSLYSAIPLVWIIMLPRYVWYQSFAFYKSTITLFLIIYFLNYLKILFNKNTIKNHYEI
jgi:hypothetical protein